MSCDRPGGEEPSCSRRGFLVQLAGGVAVGGGAALGGCATNLDPAPITDVDPPVDGRIALELAHYPDLDRPGGALMIRAPGLSQPILVCQELSGSFFAVAGICTHAGCPLGFRPERGELECPCHGARFSPNGEVRRRPARSGLRNYGASLDQASGILTVDLLAGDPGFPEVIGGRIVFPLADFPQLATPGGSVAGDPGGLGQPLLVIALEDGGYAALDATCTHLGCEVAFAAERGRIECPCHGAKFDPTGEVLSGPARRPLGRFEALREGDAVVVVVP
jgi:Rieske Fe-S protein